MRFTPAEVEILMHRLEMPDCIAECLADAGHDPDVVGERCTEIVGDWQAGQPLTVDMADPINRAIIEDCCDGCTLLADLEYHVDYGEIDLVKATRLRRAARSLTRKVGVRVADY